MNEQEQVGEYLTAREIAARERLHIDTVRTALANGCLRGHRVGNRGDWRIAVADYQAWVFAGALTRPRGK